MRVDAIDLRVQEVAFTIGEEDLVAEFVTPHLEHVVRFLPFEKDALSVSRFGWQPVQVHGSTVVDLASRRRQVPLLQLAELLENLFLVSAELVWGPGHDPYQLVAAPGAM